MVIIVEDMAVDGDLLSGGKKLSIGFLSMAPPKEHRIYVHGC
jgi:hypothetical protein